MKKEEYLAKNSQFSIQKRNMQIECNSVFFFSSIEKKITSRDDSTLLKILVLGRFRYLNLLSKLSNSFSGVLV